MATHQNIISKGETLAHYRIGEIIGRGGMGVVFRARDTKLNRTVALKFLTSGDLKDPESSKRLLLEAQAASSLRHDNIAVIHSINRIDNRTFIDMEYVEGDTIRDRLRRGPIKIHEALDYAVQIASALQMAQRHNIIHRDIKPSNLVIENSGKVKVLDFGLAKLQPPLNLSLEDPSTISTLTGPGMAPGTPGYMSPEQLRGQEVDYRTDIFSLGAVLYEMISGRRAFGASTMGEKVSRTLHDDPPPLEDRVPGIPTTIQKIVSKCLNKDPSQRYESAIELKEDLMRAQELIHKINEPKESPVSIAGLWRRFVNWLPVSKVHLAEEANLRMVFQNTLEETNRLHYIFQEKQEQIEQLRATTKDLMAQLNTR